MDMKSIRWVGRLGVVLLSGCLLAGCGSGPALSRDAKQLEKVFALSSASPAAGDPSGFKTADSPALAKTVVEALRTGDLATASKALQVLNYRSGFSSDQFLAVRQTGMDVGRALSRQAAKGNTNPANP